MSTLKKNYSKLASHYQECLEKFGDSPQGMDWPKPQDNLLRHKVMMELFLSEINRSKGKIRVLDFGCGTSHFYSFLVKQGVAGKIQYIGVDILEESIAISKKKFPKNKYYCLDILAPGTKIPSCDFVVINGLFTQKRAMSDSVMKEFLKNILIRLFAEAKLGLAFNTMSDQVDFKRRGAFHLNLTWAAKYFTQHLNRNFQVRHDYGLYENTFYIFKKALSL